MTFDGILFLMVLAAPAGVVALVFALRVSRRKGVGPENWASGMLKAIGVITAAVAGVVVGSKIFSSNGD